MLREWLKRSYFALSVLAAFYLLVSPCAMGQGSAFTYQGRLTEAGSPATNLFDFQFKLFDSPDFVSGVQQGPSLSALGVQVTNGTFTVQLDFGPGVFGGAPRFLEVALRPAGSPDAFNVLSPRQPITASAYAVRSGSAALADTALNAAQLGGLPPTGFIQNSSTQQAATNFNISGDGTAAGTLSANAVNAAAQYKIGGARVFSVPDINNTFAGIEAGIANTTGRFNSFFGNAAGKANTTGNNNTFFGADAGKSNTTATGNSFFGREAGFSNETGTGNSFFGASAGRANTTGFTNSFFGAGAGASNTTGLGNSFFGAGAGNANTTGGSNSIFGSGAGNVSTTGSFNSFFGAVAGQLNTTGENNSFFGYGAGRANTVGAGNSFFGRDAGMATTAGRNNAFFGFSAGQANTSGEGNSFFGSGAGAANTTGNFNSFFGDQAGNNTTGCCNSFFGDQAGINNTTGADNIFIGRKAGDFNTTGAENTIIGIIADVGSNNLTNATAIGARAMVTQSNSLVLGSVNGVNAATATVNVGIGTTAPADRLHIAGIIRVDTLGAAGLTDVCRNASNQLSSCSSSLRYKDRLAPFTTGLDLIKRLRPITFNWKQSGERDLGLAAEEVAQVEPLLVTHNPQGQVEGVKYDRITVALINAIKQQQAQIEALKRLVCKDHPDADVCK